LRSMPQLPVHHMLSPCGFRRMRHCGGHYGQKD